MENQSDTSDLKLAALGRLQESEHAEDLSLCASSCVNGTQRFRPLRQFRFSNRKGES